MTRQEILKGKRVLLKDALNNPDPNKALVILGNFAGYRNAVGPVARILIYKAKEKKWLIIDQDFGDGFSEEFDKHYTKHEAKEHFSRMLSETGYLHDASMF